MLKNVGIQVILVGEGVGEGEEFKCNKIQGGTAQSMVALNHGTINGGSCRRRSAFLCLGCARKNYVI